MTVLLKNEIVMQFDSGRVYKLDRVAKTITVYANEAAYTASNPIGSLTSSEFVEIYDFIKGQTT